MNIANVKTVINEQGFLEVRRDTLPWYKIIGIATTGVVASLGLAICRKFSWSAAVASTSALATLYLYRRPKMTADESARQDRIEVVSTATVGVAASIGLVGCRKFSWSVVAASTTALAALYLYRRRRMTRDQAARVDRFIQEYNNIYANQLEDVNQDDVYQVHDVQLPAQDPPVYVPRNAARRVGPVVGGDLQYKMELTPAPGTMLKKLKTEPVMAPNRLTRWLIHQIQSTFGMARNTNANHQAVRRYVLNLARGVICGGEGLKAEAIEKAIQFSTYPSPSAIKAQMVAEVASHVRYFADETAPRPYRQDPPSC